MMMLKSLKILLISILLGLYSGVYAGDENTGDFAVDEELLKLEGDPEYGEYLSGDCTACHQIDGSYNGIPSIVGWDEESFIWVMHEYKEKYREHPVMQMMAGRLANDEIAALAAYFATLE
jgi:cytochrome c